MKLYAAASLLISLPVASAFLVPTGSNGVRASLQVATKDDAATVTEKPLFDPLNIYPESSEEKQQGRIQPLEPKLELHKKVVDPMGLYPRNSPEFLAALQEEQRNVIASNERPLYDPMNLYTENTPERQQGLILTMEPPVSPAKDVRDPLGLYPQDSEVFLKSLERERESLKAANKLIYDPLGIYPNSSSEVEQGQIQPLEPKLEVVKPVTDPMGIYSSDQADEVNADAIMSKALPFLARPALLDGQLAGDVGFDPFGFAKSKEGLLWQRQAELKHSRIAMLAAAGWPLSELLDKKFASLLHLKPLLVGGDRVPSLLNGGLQQVNPFYWMGILAVAGLYEAINIMDTTNVFDPLDLFPKDAQGQRRMEEAEIKHGRLAMLAITAFAVIEAITHRAVVDSTPVFFHPPF